MGRLCFAMSMVLTCRYDISTVSCAQLERFSSRDTGEELGLNLQQLGVKDQVHIDVVL